MKTLNKMCINPCECRKNSVISHLEALIDLHSLPSLANHGDVGFCFARSVFVEMRRLGVDGRAIVSQCFLLN